MLRPKSSLGRRFIPFALAIAVIVLLPYTLLVSFSDASPRIPRSAEVTSLPLTVAPLRVEPAAPLRVEPAAPVAPSRVVQSRVFPYDHLAVQNVSLQELRLCRERNRKLSCVANADCTGPVCEHYKDQRHMGNFTFVGHQAIVARFFQTRAERRLVLAKALDDMRARSKRPFNNTIMLVPYNNGYGYLFANWYCSLVANKVDLERVQSYTMIVGTDAGARALAASLGFYTLDPTQLFSWTGRRIIEEAAPGFARGSHALINLVAKYGLVGDLINMGVDVIMMYADFIWTGEATEYMQSVCTAPCNGVFIKDGRPFLPAVLVARDAAEQMRDDPVFVPMDAANPYPQFNTGFFLLRSSALTNVFMTTLMSAGFLQQWKGTDQLIFNVLIYHVAMPRMDYRQLPERRFIPGGTLHFGKVLQPFPRPPELLAVHPSDADWHTKKIPKLGRMGLCVFTANVRLTHVRAQVVLARKVSGGPQRLRQRGGLLANAPRRLPQNRAQRRGRLFRRARRASEINHMPAPASPRCAQCFHRRRQSAANPRPEAWHMARATN